jgi:hypothetical protein
VNVVAFDQNPQIVDQYANVPTFQGLATQAGPNSPNGALMFTGTQDGTFGVLIWATS